MDHAVSPANNTNPSVSRKRSPDGATTDCGHRHVVAFYYSFANPERMKGWVDLVGWPVADGLPTQVVIRYPEVRIWSPDHVWLMLDALAEVCALWVQSSFRRMSCVWLTDAWRQRGGRNVWSCRHGRENGGDAVAETDDTGVLSVSAGAVVELNRTVQQAVFVTFTLYATQINSEVGRRVVEQIGTSRHRSGQTSVK